MKLLPNVLLAMSACMAGLTSVSGQTGSGSTQGRWDAALTLNQTVIPFRLDISIEGPAIVGTLYNGDQKQTTTSASLEDGKLTLNFDQFLTRIVATLEDGHLTGTVNGRFEAGRYISSYPLTAARHIDVPAPSEGNVPQINGTFIGKDGRVRKVHAGFAAPASGTFNLELQAEYTTEIETLLAESTDEGRAEGKSKYQPTKRVLDMPAKFR